MKFSSIQSKFLITIISAILAVAVFVGGICIYEIDNFITFQTEDFIQTSCAKEALQINNTFDDMEKSVRIMESFILSFLHSKKDVLSREKQNEIIQDADEMFSDVAQHTNGAVAYYLRFSPDISDNVTGLFYSKVDGKKDFVRLDVTDLSLYDKSDTEHVGWYWLPYEAQQPLWLKPYHNHNNNIFMISYVVPLYYENEFIGIVGMDFDYTVLTKKIDQIKIYSNGFAHLEDNGTIAYHKSLPQGEKAPDTTKDYASVSAPIKNGMTLVLSASYNDINHIKYEIVTSILFVVILFVILFSLIIFLIVRKIVNPLEKLTEASKKLADKNYDVEIAHSNTYEINLLTTAFEQMANHLKEHEKLQHLLAYRDSLTGLRNTTSYRAWVSDFEKELAQKNVDFGIMILDLNYLKETNDRYGHDTGNRLIIAASQIISDTFKRSPVFRIGGDEFLVICQNRDLLNFDELVKKLDEECEMTSVQAGSKNIPISIARGFARYEPQTDTGLIDVFNRADEAMYKNKLKMKGRD